MFAEDLENIDYNNIIICDPIKNSIIDYSSFYKIIYSNSYISYNGVFTIFKVNNLTINKDKVFFNNNNDENNIVFNKLKHIEEHITKLCSKSKIKKINYKLKDFLNNNYFKFVNNDDMNKFNNFNNLKLLSNSNIASNSNYHYFILKISGLWETRENIGMTFKIIKINNYL
jgi:hypothetical protein